MCTEMNAKDKLIELQQKQIEDLQKQLRDQAELINQLRHQLFGSSSEKSRRINPKSSSENTDNKKTDDANSNGSGQSKKKDYRWRKRKIVSAVDACTTSPRLY